MFRSIAHHFKEEEQRMEGMFSQARKEEFIVSHKADGLPKSELTTMKDVTV